MLNLTLALPEIIVLTMASVVLMFEVYDSGYPKLNSYNLAQGTLLAALIATLLVSPEQRTMGMNGLFVADPMGTVLKCVIYVVTAAVFVYSRDYLRARDTIKGEYFVLGLFAVLGMMVIVSANSLLTIYLGLELLSLCLYAMVAMQRNLVEASEAAMKYFVLGALASGMLLYGMSMLYGVAGSLDLSRIALSISHGAIEESRLLVFGLVFVVVGVAFKLGVVPFHMWIPDVYHGAPTAVTLFIGTAPKVSAFALAFRLLVDGLGGLNADWQGMLLILAALSIGVGNVIAIAQTNIKRMLAYSTIAHMGFLLLGLIASTTLGYAAAMFYAVAYTVMSAGAFGMVILLSRAGFESDLLEDFKGLSRRSPWFAFVMLILMFSMAGVPPFIGFWGKWFVLKEIVDAGFVWLAVVAVLFSIIGAYYYLRVVKLMYFDQCEEIIPIAASREMQYVLSVNGLIVLLVGLVPGVLMHLCVSALAL